MSRFSWRDLIGLCFSYSFLRRIVLQNCDVLRQATNKQLAHPYIMAIKISHYNQDSTINIL